MGGQPVNLIARPWWAVYRMLANFKARMDIGTDYQSRLFRTEW